MAQVSKFRIPTKTWHRIFDLLLEAFISNKTKTEMDDFLRAICTPTERIMFAKRIAACVLLSKGHSYQCVAEKLRMSPPTIAKMSQIIKYDSKLIMPTIETVLEKQAKELIKDEIFELFDLPSKATLRSPERKKRKHKQKKEIDERKRSI